MESSNSEKDYGHLFQRGDEKALSFFFHELYPALIYYAYQIVQHGPLAEDLASEAFVKTWRMHHKLNSYAGIKAYLYKIVHRDSMEAVAKEQQRARSGKKLPSPLSTDSPFDILVRTEVYRLIHTALKDLAPASRRVMIMHYLEGKTTGQIARELNLHTSTIKTQKMQGLKALRKIFLKPMFWQLYFCLQVFFTSL